MLLTRVRRRSRSGRDRGRSPPMVHQVRVTPDPDGVVKDGSWPRLPGRPFPNVSRRCRRLALARWPSATV